MKPLASSRILIIKPSSLGDVVHTLPLAHALKRCLPGCSIGWVVQHSLASLLRQDPAVDVVHEIDVPSTSDPQAGRGAYGRALLGTLSALRTLGQQLRARPYDLVLDLHASWRSALFALLNPGGRRIGFADAREGNRLVQHALVQETRPMHALDKNNLFAAFLACPVDDRDMRLALSAESVAAVEQFLAAEGIGAGQRLVCINPAARWHSKFWTVEGWAEVADQLAEQRGAAVVLGGSPVEQGYLAQICRHSRTKPIVAAGQLDLAATAALLRRADVYLGLDSGPMHLAAMAGTPVVALFGPTNPQLVGPYGSGHRVLRRSELPCLGCRRRTCPEPRCLLDITPQQVVAAACEVSPWKRESAVEQRCVSA